MENFTSLLTSIDDDAGATTTPTTQFSTQECTKQKKGRATNFSIEEDMLLISAWQNVSMDSIQGSNQTHQTYWNRIASYYDENRSFLSARTPNSLCHRWSAINTSVSKFIGYYNQIQGRNQSGFCEQDKERQAMEMYSSLQKKTFQLVHCWKSLRNCPKFGATIQKKTQKSPNDSPKSSASAKTPFISKPSQDSEDKMERPMGRKAAKKLKRSEHDAKSDDFIIAITQAKDTMSMLSEKRNETIQHLIELEKERLMVAEERERAKEEREKAKEERDKQMYEISILGIDTSNMEAPLAEYYNSLKANILNKKM